jgi:hypothetical protein
LLVSWFCALWKNCLRDRHRSAGPADCSCTRKKVYGENGVYIKQIFFSNNDVRRQECFFRCNSVLPAGATLLSSHCRICRTATKRCLVQLLDIILFWWPAGLACNLIDKEARERRGRDKRGGNSQPCLQCQSEPTGGNYGNMIDIRTGYWI